MIIMEKDGFMFSLTYLVGSCQVVLFFAAYQILPLDLIVCLSLVYLLALYLSLALVIPILTLHGLALVQSVHPHLFTDACNPVSPELYTC